MFEGRKRERKSRDCGGFSSRLSLRRNFCRETKSEGKRDHACRCPCEREVTRERENSPRDGNYFHHDRGKERERDITGETRKEQEGRGEEREEEDLLARGNFPSPEWNLARAREREREKKKEWGSKSSRERNYFGRDRGKKTAERGSEREKDRREEEKREVKEEEIFLLLPLTHAHACMQESSEALLPTEIFVMRESEKGRERSGGGRNFLLLLPPTRAHTREEERVSVWENFRRETEKEREGGKERGAFPPASPRDGISVARERARGRERNRIRRERGRMGVREKDLVAMQNFLLPEWNLVRETQREREKERISSLIIYIYIFLSILDKCI